MDQAAKIVIGWMDGWRKGRGCGGDVGLMREDTYNEEEIQRHRK